MKQGIQLKRISDMIGHKNENQTIIFISASNLASFRSRLAQKAINNKNAQPPA
jgi:hypothetical protein